MVGDQERRDLLLAEALRPARRQGAVAVERECEPESRPALMELLGVLSRLEQERLELAPLRAGRPPVEVVQSQWKAQPNRSCDVEENLDEPG